MNLTKTRNRINQLEADRRLAQSQRDAETIALDEIRERVGVISEAQQIAQGVAATIQQLAHRRISSVVTRCLAAIFGDDAYQFEIRFVEKRGKTEAELILTRDGLELPTPLDSAGGGVIDVAAFALRLSCLILSRPQLRRVLILDEPFKALRGVDYRERVAGMIKSLSTDLGVQFILNIDIEAYPEFELGKVVELD